MHFLKQLFTKLKLNKIGVTKRVCKFMLMMYKRGKSHIDLFIIRPGFLYTIATSKL